MEQRFAGKVALVTGAGKGLGRAYALWLAERGAHVIVNNRTHAGVPFSAEAVAQEIVGNGGVAVADGHAVETEAGAAAMVWTAIDHYGKLDILICNAGIAQDTTFTEMPTAAMHQMMDVNFWGSLYPVQAALPGMLAAGHGRIILTTSQAGLFGQPRSSLYCASKAALIGLARGLACDIKAADVRVNVVAPAAFTPMSEGVIDPGWSEFMSPAKVAPVVGWLSSDACDRSGMIFNVGAGRVRRAMIMEGLPVEMEGDDMGTCWPALDDMTGAVEARNSFASGRILMPEMFAAFPAMSDQH